MTRDLVAIWESELSAMIDDRELHEATLYAVAAWFAQMRANSSHWAFLLDGDGAAARRPRPDAAPWTAPAHAAPDGRDVLIGQLMERVAELERRLAGGPQPSGGGG